MGILKFIQWNIDKCPKISITANDQSTNMAHFGSFWSIFNKRFNDYTIKFPTGEEGLLATHRPNVLGCSIYIHQNTY